MADPFSIAAATIGLADVGFRLGRYLKDVWDDSITVDEDIRLLAVEVDGIISVSQDIRSFYRMKPIPTSQSRHHDNIEKTWHRIREHLEACTAHLDKLETSLEEITGEANTSRWTPHEILQRVDKVRKAVRKRTKDGQLRDARDYIASNQNRINYFFARLTLLVILIRAVPREEY